MGYPNVFGAQKTPPLFGEGVGVGVKFLLLGGVLVFVDLVRELGLLLVNLRELGGGQLATVGSFVRANFLVNASFLVLQMAGLAGI